MGSKGKKRVRWLEGIIKSESKVRGVKWKYREGKGNVKGKSSGSKGEVKRRAAGGSEWNVKGK